MKGKIIAILITCMMLFMVGTMPVAAHGPDKALTVEIELFNTHETVGGQGADNDGRLEIGELWRLYFKITVTNNSDSPIDDVVVRNNFDGALKLVATTIVGSGDDYYWPEPVQNSTARDNTDTVEVRWFGKTNSVHVTWEVGTIDAGDSIALEIDFDSDVSPCGKHEFISIGMHRLNSGLIAKGILGGKNISVAGNSAFVVVLRDE